MSKKISALLRRLILALILLSLAQGLPSCRPENLPASSVSPPPISGEEPGWSLLLVNAENPLPEDHPAPTFTELSSGLRVDSRAYPQLQRMMDAARAEGLQPVICSAYRPREKQQELFEKKVQYFLGQGCTQAEAETEAALLVARPGTSEHETGLALDIVDINYQLLDEHQQNTAVEKLAHGALRRIRIYSPLSSGKKQHHRHFL